jgi:hypothetical protein
MLVAACHQQVWVVVVVVVPLGELWQHGASIIWKDLAAAGIGNACESCMDE